MNKIYFLAAAISFTLGVILMFVLIPLLRRLKFGQPVRDDGPQAHLAKNGTPTMGGIGIMIALIAGSAAFVKNLDMIIILVITCIFAIIGVLDDSLKIIKKQSEGLKAWQKMLLQIIAAAALVLYVAMATENGTQTIIPFYGVIDLKGWFYPIALIAVLGTVNGANLTDGVDGLSSSVTSIICVFLAFASAALGAGLEPLALAMAGALVAYYLFNAYPARIFMGDTGSLAMGGFVCAMALMMKIPIFLIIFALIYVAEIVSVILQVGYFKLTHGKRLFKMAPLHHHFELSGFSETKTVALFDVVTVICCIISYLAL